MSGDQPSYESLNSLFSFDTPATVSTLASGSGPSGLLPSAVPGAQTIATLPPPSPHREVAEPKGKQTAEIGTQTSSFCVNTFSSKTCLELLSAGKLTSEQIRFEAEYLRTLMHGRDLQKINITNNEQQIINKHIKSELSSSVCFDFEAAAKSHNLTLFNFSRLLEEAQNTVDKLVELNRTSNAWSPDTNTTSEPTENDRLVEHSLPDSVCSFISDFDFGNLTVTDILRQIPIKERSSSGRFVTYFGSRPYSYGRTRHDPRDYPDCPAMNFITAQSGSGPNI